MFLKPKVKLLLFLVCILSWSVPCIADDFATEHNFATEHGDFFHLLFPNREDISLAYQYEPDLDEDGGPGKFDRNSFSVTGEVPLEIGPDSFFRLGGTYAARVHDFSEVRGASTDTSSNTFHQADVLLGIGTFLSKNLLLTAATTIGTYSDFDGGLQSEDFRIYGEGEVVYRVNPGAEVLTGVRCNEDFDDTPVYPFLGLRLLSEDGKLQIALTAPLELRVGYYLHPEIEVFGRIYAQGQEYRISAGSRDDFRVHTQDRNAGLGLNWWFASHLKLGLEAGVSLGDEFNYKTENPGQFDDNDLKPGGYLQANVGIAL